MSDTTRAPQGIVCAIALDPVGAGALERLVTSHAPVPGHFVCFAQSAISESAGQWQQLGADHRWQPTAWSAAAVDVARGIPLSVQTAFTIAAAAGLVAFEHTMLVVIVAYEMLATADQAAQLVRVITQVRLRFAGLRRVFLMVHGTWAAEADGPSGQLPSLPFMATPTTVDPLTAIDYVVLVGQETPEGLMLLESTACMENMAAALRHLTVGPLAYELEQCLTPGLASVDPAERFIALGIAELPISAEHLRVACTRLLHQQLATVLLTVYDADDTTRAGDRRTQSLLQQAITDMLDQPETSWPAPGTSSQDHTVLEQAFRDAGWDLRLLENLQAQRHSLYAQAMQQLLQEEMRHESRAAHWTAEERLGLHKPPPSPPSPPPQYIPHRKRIWWLKVSLSLGLLFALAAGGLYVSQPALAPSQFQPLLVFLGTAAVVSVAVAVVIMALGIRILVPSPPLPEPPPPKDLEAAQRRRRQRRQRAQQGIALCQHEQQAMAQTLCALQATCTRLADNRTLSEALPVSFYEHLLSRYGGGMPAAFDRAQQACTTPLSSIFSEGEGLDGSLARFAATFCQSIDFSTALHDLRHTLSTPLTMDSTPWHDLSAWFYFAALPRVPVWGKHTWTLLVVPPDLVAVPGVQQLARQAPERPVVYPGPASTLCLLQLTQGFDCAMWDAHAHGSDTKIEV